MPFAPQVSYDTTHHVRDHCLCLHTQRAARVLARRFDEALRPAGLTNGQFSLLMALNRPAPATLGQVADLLGADRTTLTAALKPLVQQGLALVAVDGVDARVRRLSLTAEGHRRLNDALPIWTATHGALEGELADPEGLRQGLRALSAKTPDLCDPQEDPR